MKHVVDEVARIVTEGDIPSASVSVWVKGEEVLRHAVGWAQRAPPRATAVAMPYDLASVTKPFAGGAVAMALVQRGLLDLDAQARRWVPRAPAGVTPRQLLQHAAGYPAWAPLYEGVPPEEWGTEEARRAVIDAAVTTPLCAAPGTSHTYSDLGFLTLCAVLEAAGGARLDALVDELVLAPVGADLRWGWPGAAATEDCPVRGRVVVGEVHDLNAASMGGVSTHAGLFGTATEVARLTAALLEQSQGTEHGLPDLGPAWSARGPGSHRLGWDGVSRGSYTSTGACWPDDGVGHLGYTGTSVWVAPRQGVVVALLTNRVHPVDDKEPIRAARPRVHDAVASALGWSGPGGEGGQLG
jgi:CubicO group peptidase (beta-lactamase class C family)